MLILCKQTFVTSVVYRPTSFQRKICRWPKFKRVFDIICGATVGSHSHDNFKPCSLTLLAYTVLTSPTTCTVVLNQRLFHNILASSLSVTIKVRFYTYELWNDTGVTPEVDILLEESRRKCRSKDNQRQKNTLQIIVPKSPFIRGFSSYKHPETAHLLDISRHLAYWPWRD